MGTGGDASRRSRPPTCAPSTRAPTGPTTRRCSSSATSRPTRCCRCSRAQFGRGRPTRRRAGARAAAGGAAAGHARRSISSTSRAPRSRRSASAGSACRARRPTTSRCRCMNTILGGSFTSRLNMNLREEHGYTYGAGSVFDMRVARRPVRAGAGVQTDKTAEALQGVLQRAERHPAAGAGRRADARQELRGAAASPPASRRPATSRGGSRSCSSTGCPTTTSRSYVAEHRGGHRRRRRSAWRRQYIQPDRFAVVVVGGPEGDRARHPRAEPRPGARARRSTTYSDPLPSCGEVDLAHARAGPCRKPRGMRAADGLITRFRTCSDMTFL